MRKIKAEKSWKNWFTVKKTTRKEFVSANHNSQKITTIQPIFQPIQRIEAKRCEQVDGKRECKEKEEANVKKQTLEQVAGVIKSE